MPLERCTKNGRRGWRWGARGACFTGDTGRSRAVAQAIAIEGPEGFARIDRGGKAIDDILTDEAFWEEQRAKITRVVMPVFREAFMVGATLGAEQRPAPSKKAVGLRQQLPFDFEAVAAASDEALATFTDNWWQQFSRSTQNALRASIVRAQENGLGVAAVVKDIEPLFGAQRAQVIAVSETTTLMGQGAQATYQRAGFTQWEWRTVRDARVDPICQALDKQTFPMSRQFERAHPNCRCWPVPAGEPQAAAALAAVA